MNLKYLPKLTKANGIVNLSDIVLDARSKADRGHYNAALALLAEAKFMFEAQNLPIQASSCGKLSAFMRTERANARRVARAAA